MAVWKRILAWVIFGAEVLFYWTGIAYLHLGITRDIEEWQFAIVFGSAALIVGAVITIVRLKAFRLYLFKAQR